MSKIFFSSQTPLQNPSNRLGFSLYDSSAPDVLLEHVTTTGPYGTPIQIEFEYNAINGHNYIIRVWESADASASGVVRNEWAGTVTGQTILARAPLYLKVGVTDGLTAGETVYEDSTWAGWEYIMRRNSQTYIPDLPGVDGVPMYEQLTDGGMELIDDTQFVEGEDFVIEFVPQVITADAGTPSSPFGDGVILTSNTTLDASYKNKAIAIQSSTDKIAIKLPNLTSVTAYTDLFYFLSEGGSHKNVVIQADTGQKIKFMGDRDTVILGQGECVHLFKAPFGPSGADRWVVFNDVSGPRMVGQMLFSYENDGINTLSLDGSLIDRETYARLWEWVQAQGGISISEASWSAPVTVDGVITYPNKGFFSPGNGTTTFRLPLIQDIHLKAAANAPGAHENWMSVNHGHNSFDEGDGGETGGSAGGNGDPNGGTVTVGSNAAKRTGAMRLLSNGAVLSAVGSKVKVESVLAYACIRI